MKKKNLMVGLVLGLTLLITACGGKDSSSENTSDSVSPKIDATANSKVENDNIKDSDVLGELEIIGEKTKTIGMFEITLSSGHIVKDLKMKDGKKFSKYFDQLLVFDTTIKSVDPDKNFSAEFDYSSVFCGEDAPIDTNDLSCGTYAGYDSGLVDDLAGSRLKYNVTKTGKQYYDVKKAEVYKLYYHQGSLDGKNESGYWIIKVKK
jgi:hypothetical protein